MTDDGRAALRALHDCGVIAAPWSHPGYRQLRERRLASWAYKPGQTLATHELTPRGEQLARDLFE